MKKNTLNPNKTSFLQRIHIDGWLFLSLLVLMSVGLVTLYSASGQDSGQVERQITRLALSVAVMFGIAQIPPGAFRRLSTYAYIAGLLMLIAVLLFGDMGKGAQRWLDLKFIRFQPSELMKLAVPMMVAWYISKFTLPPRTMNIVVGFLMVAIPTVLIAKQPDLGTSLLIASSGIFAIFLAGMSWRLIGFVALLLGGFAPIMWFFLMAEYQKQRVLTFLNPESDPLGSGYHIIQSKIAIGSGGVDGKGWLQGTQSQLEFLPERHTDFIFSVFSEEFGLTGVIVLLIIYLCVILRGLIIASRAQDAYSKLLAGSITLTFFVYVFVNMGMVSGLLPVVGVPLPLVSYGGTSMVTLMAGFGMLMSIATQKRLMSR
ncbi:rod shape-determining protein RodA [Alteromonas sp. KS69]|jgi:rod shape determining protein RodA|uniref:Peptidoglycan glycosyltransferase MrdB n=1 Tax=Alteromonas naphthalenivorans TaxID=715451 RepID=F5Z8P3_ALTNA|nr:MULTISPECIES: rod shape-determining protein RodA [Alteromonas]AEF03436.1 rod shape-determining protein RodA [Alteromonas naphthalenivorans]PHS52870.1 MAG: rod shape-determining protein RodA [Alteromonas sp.]RUP81967.1 rod shape-determining protein RodA [Alteromonas sp. KS69]|tara:strand:- start:7445 stop:8560 length:1116 start_codon:yes stop_codon:yes gene_type:complete